MNVMPFDIVQQNARHSIGNVKWVSCTVCGKKITVNETKVKGDPRNVLIALWYDNFPASNLSVGKIGDRFKSNDVLIHRNIADEIFGHARKIPNRYCTGEMVGRMGATQKRR
jgi:hypothetical protein